MECSNHTCEVHLPKSRRNPFSTYRPATAPNMLINNHRHRHLQTDISTKSQRDGYTRKETGKHKPLHIYSCAGVRGGGLGDREWDALTYLLLLSPEIFSYLSDCPASILLHYQILPMRGYHNVYSHHKTRQNKRNRPRKKKKEKSHSSYETSNLNKIARAVKAWSL